MKYTQPGKNCKDCLCAKCSFLELCGNMGGDTQEYCESDCIGEDGCTTQCSDFEKED